jgi:hypothetical protein
MHGVFPAQIVCDALERPVAPSMSESNGISLLSDLRVMAVPSRRFGMFDAHFASDVNTFGGMNFHPFSLDSYAGVTGRNAI